MFEIYLLGIIGIALEITALVYTFAYKNSKYVISMLMHILGTVCCLLHLCFILLFWGL
nr:MAG TPA: hypothetical protein [Caudoviricetes sp.]DAW15814.1 MAG TPA: hypothetical protein [Caudoviricetes sp.]DAZ36715.1 MAG TPA: hypothetical protein [Caudoviricetes sp.]